MSAWTMRAVFLDLQSPGIWLFLWVDRSVIVLASVLDHRGTWQAQVPLSDNMGLLSALMADFGAAGPIDVEGKMGWKWQNFIN